MCKRLNQMPIPPFLASLPRKYDGNVISINLSHIFFAKTKTDHARGRFHYWLHGTQVTSSQTPLHCLHQPNIFILLCSSLPYRYKLYTRCQDHCITCAPLYTQNARWQMLLFIELYVRMCLSVQRKRKASFFSGRLSNRIFLKVMPTV